MRKNPEFYKALTTSIDKSRIFDDLLHTIAWGTDASLYRLIPWMVVKPACEEEVSFILRKACEFRVPVTFRAAGTSLSGQAVTDSVIILISGNNWNNFRIMEYLLPRLEIVPVKETVTVFPVCTMKKMGLDKKLIELAKLCASEVIVPETNCCGFSGDKGFFNPELNRYALRNLREQIPDTVIHGYSTSRTCEIGLTLNSGISFKSIVYLVDMVTRPKNFKSF
ncbi:MAG: FAD-binding oxidoreductase [Bacteroidales bacterium]|nr:FAD-binding oxidoreductase [Bacteroidales bacterium]